MSDVDVAIVAYRGWALTRSCLEHLRRQTLPHSLAVCDNGCDQGTSGRLAAEYPEVRVVRMERNMPYPVACNAAVAEGGAEIVVMMNNDVDAPPEFLERLTAPFAGRPCLGSVASLLLRPGGREIDSAGLVADRTLAGFPRFHGLPPSAALGEQGNGVSATTGLEADVPALTGPVNTGLTLTGPSGTAAAFRRTAWEQVGGLDESILAYMEDLDLALRLRAAWWETTVALDAVAVHVGSATFGHRSAEQRRKIGHARAYLLRRYGVLRSRAALRALATEALVVAGDALFAHDAQALVGRLEGWRAGAGRVPLPPPPPQVTDPRIGFLDSLRLRRGIYMGGRAGRRGGAAPLGRWGGVA